VIFLRVKVIHFYFNYKNEIQKRREDKGKTEKENVLLEWKSESESGSEGALFCLL